MILENIKLPELKFKQSQIILPLYYQDQFLGVIDIESPEFIDADNSFKSILISITNIFSMRLFLLKAEVERISVDSSYDQGSNNVKYIITYHTEDECTLINDDYFIRGIPAKIFYKI